MNKKFMATGLAAAMLAGCMATAQADDMVTVSLFIPTLATYTEEAISAVETEMNRQLAEKYGIQVDLHYTEMGTFEQVANLAMTTDELDITCYFTEQGQLGNLVNNGQLLDITDYFENASEEFKNTFTEAEMKASTVNGRLYGVVRKYQYGGKAVVLMNADMVAEMGIDPLSVTDMDSLGELLYQVHEKYPDIYPLVPQQGADITWNEPWEEAIGGARFIYADRGSTELGSLFELETFRTFCSYTHQWYEDGLIMPDAISNTIAGATLVGSGAAFACMSNADIDPLDALYPGTVYSSDIHAPYAGCADIGNLQYGISSNSAHPDEAFTLLEAIYTDEELITTLCYGIEGEHWAYDENGRADFPEGVTSENETYGGFIVTAVYPNYILAPEKATALVDDYQAAVDEWDNSVEVSKCFGWRFDTSEYTDFLTAYANVEEKYKDAIVTGSIALDDVLPQIQSELEAIGYYDVIAEAQADLDAYLAQQ